MLDGKVSNQFPKHKIDCGYTFCAKCSKRIPSPEITVLRINENEEPHEFWVCSFLLTSYYIYESKSGRASCYCSKYCRNKHNHRFNKSN